MSNHFAILATNYPQLNSSKNATPHGPTTGLGLDQQSLYASSVTQEIILFQKHNRQSSNESVSLSPPRTPSASPPQTVGCASHDDVLRAAVHAYEFQHDYGHAVRLCTQLHMMDPCREDVLLLLGASYYHLRDYFHCLLVNNKVILLNPLCSDAYINLANSLYQLGSIDLAITYYTTALQLKPDRDPCANTYANLASAYVEKGMIEQAVQAYMAALALDPKHALARCGLGDVWKSQKGRQGMEEARQCFLAAIECDATCSPALRGLGDCARECGDIIQAISYYSEAIKLVPNSFEALTGLGIALNEAKRTEEAEAIFAKTAMLRPNCAITLGNLAGAYYENRKFDQAIDMYRRALCLNPSFAEAMNNLGNALRQVGRYEEAVACYTSCIQLQLGPKYFYNFTDNNDRHGGNINNGSFDRVNNNNEKNNNNNASQLVVSYSNLGSILKFLGRNAECISVYEHIAFKLQPSVPESHVNLGFAYKDAGRHEEAITSYNCALALRPNFPQAFANLLHSLQCVCDWKERETLFQRLEREVRLDLLRGTLPSVQPFHALTYPFASKLVREISNRYAVESEIEAKKLPGAMEFLQERYKYVSRLLMPGERLRVGYVSSDFVNHPLAHLMGSVFGLHNRSRIEVFCYSLAPSDGSEWRVRIESESEHFLDVSGWSTMHIARRIASDGIHVLFNLNGYTKGARNDVFALRPAPVQASFMGFPATMAADYIPWIVLDKIVCPPESRECYGEKGVAYMPHTYFVNDYRRSYASIVDGTCHTPTRAEIGLPENKIVYSCANQLYKLDPETFNAWCNILKRVPNSVLWLLRFPPSGEPRIRAEAAARGVTEDRIIFTDVAAKPLHIARSGLADVYLDTPFCNAHTTGCDVLWGGVPMITLPLKRMASRVAASLCHATGLGKAMVVSNLEEYEDRAVELGLDDKKRNELRKALDAARTSAPLFDTACWVAHFDDLVVKMWEIHCEGNGPRDFSCV